MKKELFTLCILVGIMLSSVPMAYAGACAPPGTVYRGECPGEVLINSECFDCDPFDNGNLDWC